MSDSLQSFIQCLRNADEVLSHGVGLAPGAEEIADMLWLAKHLSNSVSDVDRQDVDSQDETELEEDNESREEAQFSEQTDAVNEDAPDKLVANVENNAQSSGKPLMIPAAAALRQPLKLARSLRVLARKVESRTQEVIDEEATAIAIAEKNPVGIVKRPAKERWLDLELVVEQSRVSSLWAQTSREFVELLERLGAFRTVRVWTLSINEDKKDFPQPVLTSGLRTTEGKSTRVGNPKELVDSSGRRLVMLLSDCISPLWRQGIIHSWLSIWGKHGPTVIIQWFPVTYWARTGLRSGDEVWLSALAPGISNDRLKRQYVGLKSEDWVEPDEEVEPVKSILVPVTSLEPEYLTDWSRVVSGYGAAQACGRQFDLNWDGTEWKGPIRKPRQLPNSGAERVRLFSETASEIAKELALLMSLGPVSPEITNLIQETLLPQSEVVHVAEVFLSGLLEPTDSGSYQFLPGVQQLLQESATKVDEKLVFQVLSRYISERYKRTPREFKVFLQKHSGWSEEQWNEIEGFAELLSQVKDNQFLSQVKDVKAVPDSNVSESSQVELEKGVSKDFFKLSEPSHEIENYFEKGYACVIGVGADVPSTVNDARGIAKTLRDSERCAYPEQQVHLLTEKTATRRNIIATLEYLAETTDVESTVLIYFAGHGFQITKPFKSYYLLPYGYSTDDLSETALSGAELVDLLREIPSRKLLLLLDCCHAGGPTDLSGFQSEKAPLPPEARRMFAKGGGRMIIGSSLSDELSYTGHPYSAFVTALIKGLCGQGISKEDGYVRAADLALYASRTVSAATQDRQHPVLDIEKADNFVLAYYAGGELKPKDLPPELKNSSRIKLSSERLSGQTAQMGASASRSIDGDVHSSKIISGDSNIAESNNVVQKGKYNIQSEDMRTSDVTNPNLNKPQSELERGSHAHLDAACQNRDALERYLVRTLQRLKQNGCLDIRKGIKQGSYQFSYAARIENFELPFRPVNPKGDAFFVFSEFSSVDMPSLRQYSGQVLQWVKTHRVGAGSRSSYNARLPSHFCFAIALVDDLTRDTRQAIKTTNPLNHSVDLMWYEVPIVYELNKGQLYFYDQPTGFFENFKGEVVWKPLRNVIKKLLTLRAELPIGNAVKSSRNQLTSIVNRIASNSYTDADISMLREAFLNDEARTLLQLGKYNISIGQGDSIQIGDRTYVEIDDIAIQAVILAIKNNGISFLNYDERKKLRQAILTIYSSLSDLNVFIEEELNEKLEEITDKDNFEKNVFQLLKWANSTGRTSELIQAFFKRNRTNPIVVELQKELLNKRSLPIEKGTVGMQSETTDVLSEDPNRKEFTSSQESARTSIREFSEALMDGDPGADWIDSNLSKLADHAGQHSLKGVLISDLQNFEDEAFDDYLRSIEQYLESISHCLKWGRSDILAHSDIPLIFQKKLYVKAFLYVRNTIPSYLEQPTQDLIEYYLDILIETLR